MLLATKDIHLYEPKKPIVEHSDCVRITSTRWVNGGCCGWDEETTWYELPDDSGTKHGPETISEGGETTILWYDHGKLVVKEVYYGKNLHSFEDYR